VTATFTDESIEARDGCKIAFGRMGDSNAGHPRIVLIHALAMDRSFWQEVAEQLADSIEVLAIDCRGAGQSDKPSDLYSLTQFADDIADIFDAIGWENAVISGASMGGCVSIAFAAAHPQRTAGLGLIDTTAWYGPKAPEAWAGRAAKAAAGGMAALIDFQKDRWFSEAFRNANPQRVQSAVDVFLGNDVDAYVATCTMLGACDLRSALPGISVPTRILVGEEDYATPIAMAEALHEGVTASTLRVMEKVRHFSPIEVPDLIADELRELSARC